MYKVKVLMSTYNGEKYLDEQIKSIFEQKNVEVSLLVRDDGSSDRTLTILSRWSKTVDLKVIEGNNIGYAKSFMQLVETASGADYYAFSDQDDVWMPEKLITAINHLDSAGGDEPHLYMSQAVIVDKELNVIEAKFHKRYVSLDRLIAHNFAIGCTMVFDDALRNIIKEKYNQTVLKAGHDYWISCVASAVGASIYWDVNGYVLYRQHGENASGKIVSVRQAIRAVKKILYDWKHIRSNIAKCIISEYYGLLSEENRKTLELAVCYQDSIVDYFRLLLSKKYLSKYVMVDIITKLSILIFVF